MLYEVITDLRSDDVNTTAARIRSAVLLAVTLIGPITRATEPTTPAREASANDRIHRVVGILNYIIGDYPLAVSNDGQVLNEGEFREQIGLLDRITSYNVCYTKLLRSSPRVSGPVGRAALASARRM